MSGLSKIVVNCTVKSEVENLTNLALLGQTFIIFVLQFIVFRLTDNQEIFKQEIYYFPSPQ